MEFRSKWNNDIVYNINPFAPSVHICGQQSSALKFLENQFQIKKNFFYAKVRFEF